MSNFYPTAKHFARPAHAAAELWGGVECTCNRVGDRYFDQMNMAGHLERLTDIDEFGGLGIRTLRTGLLWERQAEGNCWKWFDLHLQRLHEASIRPIAGLVHHGSGPQGTSLLDPLFPEKVSAYARRVAERYPWVDSYTPINEPNTTARFSAMYGVWYPHHVCRASYLRALLNQIKGIVLSMRAIRSIRPDARLIQTEDVGRISGTEELRQTWELLNARQWLTFDLLCGQVDRHHPMFAYMGREGIAEADILWFAENPCLPDVVGVNYYVTSDRYLDHRRELYPADRGSAEGPFVDVEAVRVDSQGVSGVESLLTDAWNRYGLPVAITEVHLGSSVDEQIRWLAESWEAVTRARSAGVNCVAMTAWALLGSYYWNQLVTRENGHYEPGVFDVRSGKPVPTELVSVIKQIAIGQTPRHEALSRRGWWHQSDRFRFPPQREYAA